MDNDVVVFSLREKPLSDDQWKTIHEILSNGTVEEMASNFRYEYFRKYCYLPESRFCFNMNFVYFNDNPRQIDNIYSEESFFQQSTVQDFYDLTFEEIMLLKQIYEFTIGDFP